MIYLNLSITLLMRLKKNKNSWQNNRLNDLFKFINYIIDEI